MAQTETIELKEERKALAGWPMVIAWAGMLVFALHACTHMVAAGDTWVAMACGRHFVHHGVDTVEPFSANSHDPGPTEAEVAKWPGWAQWITEKVGLDTVRKWHPTGWVNQNWLTHVIFYSLVPESSYEGGLKFTSNALVYWKFAIYIITIVCVFYTGTLMGANPALSAVFSCFALFIGRSFLDIRPAGFSNMLVAVFLLILALAVYRHYLYIWLLVPVTVFWSNVHGGYVYIFIMLVPFIGWHLLTALRRNWALILYNVVAWPFFYFVAMRGGGASLPKMLFLLLLVLLDIALIFWKSRLVSLGWKAFGHAVAASVVSFVAMVVLNPFHLTNLTHTFVISVSEHAARWRDIHEWHPAFDWDNPVGTAVPFLILYILSWIVLLIWLIVRIRTELLVRRMPRRRKKDPEDVSLPQVNVAQLLIAAFTIYMAIRSRRFIPVAAIAACPVLALLIDRIIRFVSASISFRLREQFETPAMSGGLRTMLTVAGGVAVLFFGTWWGLKFKRVYLDPWPADPSNQLSNVFMRMTASDAKPFYAMRFISDNELSGKMFNYWTEGGFIAWGQDPNSETGRTPLRLFMDGRAQAAYNRDVFDVWTYIMSGGPVMRELYLRRKSASEADYKRAGMWIGEQLREHGVWITLMPAAQFNKNFVMSIEQNPEWRQVFLNNKQKIFVDYSHPKGKELFDGILTGRTEFPDSFTMQLTKGHVLLAHARSIEDKKKGVELLIEAFNENESPAPLLEMILTAARYVELRPGVTKLCRDWYEDFTANQAAYRRQNGYRLRIEAARLACIHLEKISQLQRQTAVAQTYRRKKNEFARERNRLSSLKRW